MADVLKIENLTVAYRLRNGQDFAALKNLSLTVEKGSIVGVVGQSGAGKSTIGKAALGLLGENARIADGRIVLHGSDITRLKESGFAAIRGKRIGYVYQNPMTALNPFLTIGEQLVEAIEANTKRRGVTARDYAIELLKNAEVPNPEDRLSKFPHQLSGGLCQRIVFAIAISAQPDLIIADEPTTALDVTVQKAVLATLRKLARQENISIVLITHDMGVVSEMCDHVYVLHQGQMVEHGATGQILGAPQKAYTQQLISAIPTVDRKLHRFDVVQSFEKTPGRDRAIDFLTGGRKGAMERNGTPLLSVRNLTKTFFPASITHTGRTGFKAVDDVSFDVFPGETLGIVGESGSGKSTIGRSVLGLYPADRGHKIYFRSREITEFKSKRERLELCRSLQCIFQDPYSSLNPRMSAGENITYGIKAHGTVGRSQAKQLAGDLLEVVGLSRDAAKKMPHAFSGGERQRIGIARALAFRPELLFCDEPTSALDVTVQAEILNLMKDLQDELGLTLVFVSHDLAVVRQMCDRVLVMKSGQVIEQGPADQILVSPRHSYTQGLLEAMPRVVLGSKSLDDSGDPI